MAEANCFLAESQRLSSPQKPPKAPQVVVGALLKYLRTYSDFPFPPFYYA